MTFGEHAMLGGLASFVGPYQRWGWRGTVMTVVAAIAPDVDAVCWLFVDRERFFHLHRAILHGLPGLIVLSVALAAFWRWGVGLRSFGLVLVCNLLCAMTNPLVDMLYGLPDVRFFWPFHKWGWSSQTLRWGDLIALGLLMVPCLWIWRRPQHKHIIAPVFLGALAVYLVVRVLMPHEPDWAAWRLVTGGWLEWVYNQLGLTL